MANVAHPDETIGFDRSRFANLPLAIVQNKMYAASTREIVGDASAKLRWARAAGAVVGFTWLPTQHVEFSTLSGIPHHRLPFGVDIALYGRHAEERKAGGINSYEYVIGFTGASSIKYPLRQSIIRLIRSLRVKAYLGTWQQTALKTTHNNSWKALDREGYVRKISLTKMWVSTTGPSNIVGTRYFEVLASGTTMLLCNKAPSGVYDGLFEDGVHAVVFDGMDDLRSKILYYSNNETARRAIVDAAFALTKRIHSWDTRAQFITKAIEAAVQRHDPKLPYYSRPADALRPPEPYLGCLDGRRSASAFAEIAARRPLRRYTVESCANACRRRSTHFALQCGGFCSGNGHRLGRCFCAKVPFLGTTSYRQRPDPECATTCSLHDARPCGGWDAIAVYSLQPLPQVLNDSDAFHHRQAVQMLTQERHVGTGKARAKFEEKQARRGGSHGRQRAGRPAQAGPVGHRHGGIGSRGGKAKGGGRGNRASAREPAAGATAARSQAATAIEQNWDALLGDGKQ